jgi:hypothetical protein
MRQADVDEVWHSSRTRPLAALEAGARYSSRLLTVEWQGRPVAAFGIVGQPGGLGHPWMLATDDLSAIRKTFLRECRPVVEGWLREYPRLSNAVWSKNAVHIAWIKWLGFTFDGADVRNGQTFLHFYRNSNV